MATGNVSHHHPIERTPPPLTSHTSPTLLPLPLLLFYFSSSNKMNTGILLQSKGSFSIFFFLISSLLREGPVFAADLRAEACEPKNCGNGLNIRYPFWIQGQHPSYCGYPSFEVTCKSSVPVLKLLGLDYRINDIFYDSRSLLVTQADFLESDCPFPYYNLTLSRSLFRVNSTNRSLFFLFNCSERLPDYQEIPCFDDTAPAYFVRDRLNFYSTCESIIAPVFLVSGTVGSDYAELLKLGFLLDWTAKDCTECRTSGGQCGYDNNTASFMCICRGRTDLRSCGAHNLKKTRIMIGVFAATAGLSLECLFLLVYFRHYRKSHSKKKQGVEELLHKYGSLAQKRYKYSEIKRMTKSFSHKLGQGGYGNVFKGNLYDGHPVAVKVLHESKGNGEEFVNEVVSIGGTSHINIVCLLGFCLEGSKRALVYEFMPNGSLEKFIYTEIPYAKIKLGWEKLYEIAVGIARGLEYLHYRCNTRMVHFDIKPHNILLDEEFCPKISDFGLAKLCPPQGSIISVAGAKGTVGYIAPEIFSRNFGVVSSKSDVYSYGMMVLEMVGGRKNIDARAENTSEIYFPHWIYDHLDQYDSLEACGVTSETDEIAKKMIIVGLWCIQMLSADRPSISRVVNMLEGSISDLQMPPRP